MARRKSETERKFLWLVRQPQGLVPASQFDAEEIERYRIGSRLTCTIEQPKNEALVRLYRGLIGKVAKGIGVEADTLHWRLRLKCGLYREARDFDGSIALIPRSTTDLDQAEFSAFYERACEVITTEILPGATVEEILEGTFSYIGLRDDLGL